MESTTDITCDICQKTILEQTFTAHQRLHSEDKFHPCNLCGIVFINSDEFNQHNCDSIINYQVERTFSCDICQSKFKQLSNLKIHKRIHTGETPYSCEICKKSFTQSSNLKRHIRVHTGEKPYFCEICQLSFTQSSDLTKHKRIHTEGKPYCEICKKSFSYWSTLTIHKRLHTGETPYSCDICHLSFTLNSDLTKHRRSHSGEKPYSCEICKKSFSDSFALKRHEKSSIHVKRQESLNADPNSNLSNHVDIGEAIKAEDIKTENTNQEDGITEDIIFKEEDNLIDDIKEEIEEDVSVNYFLSIQEENNDIKEED